MMPHRSSTVLASTLMLMSVDAMYVRCCCRP